MKRVACFALLLCSILTVQAQEKFTIEGKLNGLKDPAMIYLGYVSNKGVVIDSMVSKNGAFAFKGSVEMPVQATLFIRQGAGLMDTRIFWIEKGKIKVAGDSSLKTAAIKGGKNQADWTLLTSLLQPVEDRMGALYSKIKEYNGKDQTVVNEMEAQRIAIGDEWLKVHEMFIRTHPDSYVSLNFLGWGAADRFDPTLRLSLLNGLSPRIRNTEAGKKMAEIWTSALKNAVGRSVPDFTQNNTEGIPVSLSSLKGSYVLVDFWASWCGSCRVKNRELVELYNKYKGKNFEIIAISLNDKKEAWLKAIKDDGLFCIHVSDLKGYNNAVYREYGITTLPASLLLDPNGIIIARNPGVEELKKKLEEVIAK